VALMLALVVLTPVPVRALALSPASLRRMRSWPTRDGTQSALRDGLLRERMFLQPGTVAKDAGNGYSGG
jgi:hypothetical protein